MRVRVLIILGGGGWGREAMEILPALNETWDKVYLATHDCAGWLKRNGLEGPLHLVPPLRTSAPRSLPVKLISAIRSLLGVAWLMLRVRPHAILGVCSDLSLPAMALGRMMGCRTYYVESLTRVRTPSRVARLLDRLHLVDKLFVQHEPLAPALRSARHFGGIL